MANAHAAIARSRLGLGLGLGLANLTLTLTTNPNPNRLLERVRRGHPEVEVAAEEAQPLAPSWLGLAECRLEWVRVSLTLTKKRPSLSRPPG